MKPVVNFKLCEGNGFCAALLPAVFELRDDDYAYVTQQEVPEADHALLQQAVRQCPRQAISIEELPL